MEGGFQDQGQIDKDMQDWLYPRWSQPYCSFFSQEERQESIHIEDSSPEGALIINQDPEGGKSTMLVVKFPDKVEGSGDNIDALLCGGLYKEEDNYLVP